MADRIQPARDIKNGGLAITPVGEGNVIVIRLKNHWADWTGPDHGGWYYRSCGPYTMCANNSHWSYDLEGGSCCTGFASSLAEAKMKCMESVLLSVLGCLEFVD